MEFPDLLERFLTYVRMDTRSSEDSSEFPSTKNQLELAEVLRKELLDLGLEDVHVTRWGYVFATLKTNQTREVPTIALIAHMDTSPDVPGDHVNPVIHKGYDGGDIALSGEKGLLLRVQDNPLMREKIGMTIITTDGSTLLGADDKAGIAEIMSAVRYLRLNPDRPRPNIRVLFTPDEEIGRGTDRLDLDEIRADYGYTVDGGKPGDIEDETFCADTVEVRIRGRNVHPGHAKDKLVNSIKIAADFIGRLPAEISPEKTEKREGYIHPNSISGSVDLSALKLLIRDFEEEGLKQKEALIKNLVDSLGRSHPGAVLEMQVRESYRNMKTVLNEHPEVLLKAEEAIRLAGLIPRRGVIRGGTDGARLCFMGLPTPNLFTGGSNFHSRYEWIALEDMEKAAETIVHLMGLWAQAPSARPRGGKAGSHAVFPARPAEPPS